MNTEIKCFLSNPIIREYKTKKAAEKFCKRLIKGGWIQKSKTSYFGYRLKEGQKIFQVYSNEI